LTLQKKTEWDWTKGWVGILGKKQNKGGELTWMKGGSSRGPGCLEKVRGGEVSRGAYEELGREVGDSGKGAARKKKRKLIKKRL